MTRVAAEASRYPASMYSEHVDRIRSLWHADPTPTVNSLDSADRRRFYVDRSWTGLRSDVP
ncbi:hypothetical protein A6F59_11260 [Prescottella equi]|nr:hypothetical protein A6F59_11260 [Prescottella equi]